MPGVATIIPLNVALIVKNENGTRREARNMGLFSYGVPEFQWTHFTPGKRFRVDTKALKRQGFDLIFHEDAPEGEYHNGALPVVYYAIDSTLSEDHYRVRHIQAKSANLVLVDHDTPARFRDACKRVVRLPYCVNDRLFKDYGHEKSVDVAFYCSAGQWAGGEARRDLRNQLDMICKKHGWSYRSGMLPLEEYAQAFNRSKVLVNLPRTLTNRPHRVFDGMASRTCLLTGELPPIEEDCRQSGVHYAVFEDIKHLENQLEVLLGGAWQTIADNGYQLVQACHTWAVRAKELRTLLERELGL